MTLNEKLAQLKALLKITDQAQDADLIAYLYMSKLEILAWLYGGKTPEGVTDVPMRYEPTQIMACMAGFSLSGLENQTASTENGIGRTFKHSSMIEFIRENTIPYARVM